MAGKLEKFILTDKEEIDSFNKLISLNPQPGKSFNNYLKVINRGHYKICLYKWFTGLDEDIYVTQSHLYKHLNDNSKFVKITPQIYYDVIVLGLTNINDRPKCEICGKISRWDGFKRGYLKTCSEKCSELLRDSRMSEQGLKNFHKLQTKESREKQRESHKGWSPSEKQRKQISQRMKDFYKTPKGLEMRKNSSRLLSERNIEMMKDKSYYNKRTGGKYKTGIYHSKVWNKDFNYDSSWEINFIKFFEKQKWQSEIKIFDRCLDSIIYKWDDGTEHRYLPDFYIKFKSGLQVVIELKPANLIEKDPVILAKRIAAKKYFAKRNIKYIILSENELFTTRYIKYTKLSESLGIVNSFNIYDYIV